MKLFSKNDLYSQIRKQITRVRDEDERPNIDPSSLELDTYLCDLCNGRVSGSTMMQCPFCGRWVCKKSDWKEKELACTSCVSIINVIRESFTLEEKKQEREELLKAEEKKNKRESNARLKEKKLVAGVKKKEAEAKAGRKRTTGPKKKAAGPATEKRKKQKKPKNAN